MNRRSWCWLVWLAAAALLYFFENGTGTRIVLICTLLLPLIPSLRRVLFGEDAERKAPREREATVRSFSARGEEEPGEVRAWIPGDPVSRIHWKLSAKRGELLVRGRGAETAQEAGERTASVPAGKPDGNRAGRPRAAGFALLAAALALALLWLIPEARRGAQALCNRLFAASEAVNAYVYDRFAVPEGQSVTLAAALTAGLGLSLAAALALSRSRLAPLCALTALALGQAYFGLALPGWLQAALFALAMLSLAARPLSRWSLLRLGGAVLAVSLAVLILLPGVDGPTEDASERARDFLSRAAAQLTGGAQELPEGETETRHVHTRSLVTGEGEAEAGREFRLVTVEEEQISMPHWVDWLRIALLLLLTVALVILPFLPFALLNARRRKTQAAREAFASEDVGEAVRAVFSEVIAWLEATGHSAGNRPYREWAENLPPCMPEGYGARFRRCALAFEEAVYSDHPLEEEKRGEALELLEETGEALWAQADRRQKLRLRYWDALWG